MNQMPSSGTTSSGGGSPIRHVSGATGHSSIVVPTSASPSSPRSASLSFVSAATTTFSFAENESVAMKPGIEPPWPARIRSPSRRSPRPSP